MTLGTAHALISGLREGGSETEMTRAFASTLAADPEMASGFVRLLIASSPHAARVDLSGLPAKLHCRHEVALDQGRADLSFTSRHGDWHVIVEIKIYAGYGTDQIGRYLRSFHPAATRTVLAALTRDVPTYGDDSDDHRWAGSVQWAKILPGLRQLCPVDVQLAVQWPLFLDVLEEEGSMGFTQSNPDKFRAWADYPAARNHVSDFVDSVRRPLLASLQHALGPDLGAPDQRASFSTRGKVQRAVTTRLGKILVGFRIPATGPERLTAGVWGWGEPRFIVEIPFPRLDVDPEKRNAAVGSLLERGFESWRDRILTNYLSLNDDLLQSAELEDRVVTFAGECFAAIALSGILDLEPTTPIPDEEEAGG